MFEGTRPIVLLAFYIALVSPSLIGRASNGTSNPFLSIEPSNILEWRSCYEKSPASKIGSINCARLLAPLDYSNRSFGHVELAVARFKGSGSGEAVFYNPGGPGADPVEDVLTKISLLRTYVGNNSDIITVVPRGVAATFPPMTCDATNYAALQSLWESQDTLPGHGPESLFESYAYGESIGLDCSLIKPDLIPYSGTVSAAYDMEFVRKALGQDYLHYYGTSYGTALGGTYAALFPDRVGRMVLDGVLDLNDYYKPVKNPSLDIGDADLALEHFYQACHKAGPNACLIWSQNIKDIKTKLNTADQQIYNRPLPVPGYGLLKWPLFRSGVYYALYQPSQGFIVVAGAVSEILDGTAGPYLLSYMELVQAAALSTSDWPIDPKSGLKNSPNAGTFISCADSGGSPHQVSITDLETSFSQYEKVSEYFAGISAQFVWFCWGANLSVVTPPIGEFADIKTAHPILFVGNSADPTTPIRNAHRMSQAFVGSHVLTIDGTGHISYSAAQDPTRCASKWIAPYLRDGILPPEGTICDGMQMPFASG